MNELHIWLYHTDEVNPYRSYIETVSALKYKQKKLHTYQIHFCHTKYLIEGYRLFIHFNDFKKIEIKLGENVCTKRIIKLGHNLEKLLLAGEFDSGKDV